MPEVMPEAMDPPVPTEAPPDPFEDARLLEIWAEKKEEAFDSRWALERDWLRNLYYIANRASSKGSGGASLGTGGSIASGMTSGMAGAVGRKGSGIVDWW